MWTFQWNRYVSVQIEWAQALMDNADDMPGYAPCTLRSQGASVMAHASRFIGASLGDQGLPRCSLPLEAGISANHDIQGV